MNLFLALSTPFLPVFKKLVYYSETNKFKKALQRNPQDHNLKARFAKYCLNQYLQDPSASKAYTEEAVNQFGDIVHSDTSDLEVFYLMGKYYQRQDGKKAIEVYRKGLRRYNEFSEKNLDFKREQVETAFTIALNLLKLSPGQPDPELDAFFKHLRRTYLANFFDRKTGTDVSPEDSTGALSSVS